jgi:hypothetical protein
MFNVYGILIVGFFLVSTLGGAYVYYTSTQARIAVLVENNAKLEIVAKTNQETIEQMQIDSEENEKRSSELNGKLRESETYKDELIGKLRKHNLTKLAEQKPGLIETRINDATQKLFNDFEQITTE